MNEIRVLLADDQPLLVTGIKSILEAAPDIKVVGVAANGKEAVLAATALNPDVICMDVQMPELDGLAATSQIVAQPEVTSAVLILTTYAREDYLVDSLQAGASGYLLKTTGGDQLVAAVRAVAAGERLIAPEMTGTLISLALDRLREKTRVTPAPPEVALLTARELEVLQAIARGLTNQEIAAELFISLTTVKTHVSSILWKLRLRDRVQIVVFAYQHGLTL